MRTPVPAKHPMLVMDEAEATVIGDSMALVREGLRAAPEAAPAAPTGADMGFADTLAPGTLVGPPIAAPAAPPPVASPQTAPASPVAAPPQTPATQPVASAAAPIAPASQTRPAAPSVTQSGENALSTGEHTLIIPRPAMDKPSGGSSIARVIGLTFVVLVVIASAAVAGLYAAGVRPTSFARLGGGPASGANPPQPTPPTPPTPSIPTVAVTAADAAVAEAPADAAVEVADAAVLALADAAAATPLDAAVAVAPVDAAVAPQVAPAPTAAADVAGITPDSELPRDRADAADVLVEDALRLMQAGNLDAAGIALDHSLELDHVNPQGYEAMSRYRVLRRQYPDAIAAAERACELRSSQSRYVVQLGDAYAASGAMAAARRSWQRAVAMDRNRDARTRLEQNPGP